MADVVTVTAQAVHDIIWATGEFKSGTPFAKRSRGTMPAFQVWYGGWDTPSEPAAVQQPKITTHKFQIELYCALSSNEGDSQERLRNLVEVTVNALRRNPRLNDTCLRSRVANGLCDMETEGNNPYLIAVLTLEVDRMNW